MIQKTFNRIKKVLSLTPRSAVVNAVSQYLSAIAKEGVDGVELKVAVEGVEDPLYFGLFAAIVQDLRRENIIDADLLQTRSINGAIGTDLKSKLARNWIIARLLNDQWARVNRKLVGKVAYRSQPVFWVLGRHKDRKQALKLWSEMRALESPDKLCSLGIQIGDLVIDSYLRFRPSPRFDVCDPFVFAILQQAVRDLNCAIKYFSESRPRLYFTSYSTYIEHGIPVRVAVSMGVAVRVYGNLTAFGKRLSLNDFYHTSDTSQYRAKFESLATADKCAALNLAESQLRYRLAGGIDSATSYMRRSAYVRSETAVPDVDGAVVIFLHDFYDSPHVYKDLVFPDFWAWICFTIETLKDAGVTFWLKPHPNQRSLSEGVLVELQKRFKEARFISSKVTNAELVTAGMVCGVTVYGTVAHELAYLGVPSIACARHPHVSFDFCRTARNIDEFRQMLRTPNFLPLKPEEMRNQALAFYYMHNLHGSAADLEKSTWLAIASSRNK